MIGAMEKLGLARRVVRITPERQRERLAAESPGEQAPGRGGGGVGARSRA